MPEAQVVCQRNNVRVVGRGSHVMMLAHGFGCDQSMFRFLQPELERHFTLVLFDYVGAGGSDLAAFDAERYSSLTGYAQDIIDILESLELHDVTFVGHSVSSMIGLLAAQRVPTRFARFVMLSPSPCYLNKPPDYPGGFEYDDLHDLIDLMDKNYLGWASHLAPLVMGPEASGEHVRELANSFCTTDPLAAKVFAQATFFSDYRYLLPETRHPALILQSRQDTLAPPAIGRYMHERMPLSELEIIEGEGHCLHVTHPERVWAAMNDYFSNHEAGRENNA
ncbi:alpha/beta fold hydrolase [Aidingimonas lacisalsi]|uniref:alpha/beta fold hydrolase n=1 Tax=Aidingimonas lacisalsi TaxID=2604086 RepID=UPI0011D2A4DC|nr:alpha/beta hydrolase [Aidingimonas lacisalsi]